MMNPQVPPTRANRGLAIKAESLPLDSVSVTSPTAGLVLTSKRSIPREGWYAISGMTSTGTNAVSNVNLELRASGTRFLGTLASRTTMVPFAGVFRLHSGETVDVVAKAADSGVTYFVDSLVVTEIGPGEGV